MLPVWSAAKYLFELVQQMIRTSVIVGRQCRKPDPWVVHEQVCHEDFPFRLADAVANQDQVAASLPKYLYQFNGFAKGTRCEYAQPERRKNFRARAKQTAIISENTHDRADRCHDATRFPEVARGLVAPRKPSSFSIRPHWAYRRFSGPDSVRRPKVRHVIGGAAGSGSIEHLRVHGFALCRAGCDFRPPLRR